VVRASGGKETPESITMPVTIPRFQIPQGLVGIGAAIGSTPARHRAMLTGCR
jgi:hypothetical protein